jgi:hypothetical protein
VSIGTRARYDPGMEPNRFDDVESRILEEPAAPRAPRRHQRRLGHAAIAGVAALALTGSLAAGASALTSTAQAPTRSTETSQAEKGWYGKRDGLCRKGEHRRSSAVNY